MGTYEEIKTHFFIIVEVRYFGNFNFNSTAFGIHDITNHNSFTKLEKNNNKVSK